MNLRKIATTTLLAATLAVGTTSTASADDWEGGAGGSLPVGTYYGHYDSSWTCNVAGQWYSSPFQGWHCYPMNGGYDLYLR